MPGIECSLRSWASPIKGAIMIPLLIAGLAISILTGGAMTLTNLLIVRNVKSIRKDTKVAVAQGLRDLADVMEAK